MSKPAHRHPEYDYLRVAAVLAVVAIHVAAPHVRYAASHDMDGTVGAVTRWLLYAVPALVFISGALVWGKPEPMGVRGYGEFLKRRFTVVGVPYVLWTLVYFAVNQLLNAGQQASGVLGGLKLLAIAVLSGSAGYHLYFVPVLLTLYVLTPIARRVVRRSPEALLIAGLSVSLWGYDVARALAGASRHPDDFLLPLTMLVQLTPYMALGAWYAVRAEGVDSFLRRAWWILLLGGVWVRMTDWASLGLAEPARLVISTLAGVAIVLGLVGGFRLIPGRNSTSDARAFWLSALAYGVYLAHPLVILAGRLVIGRLELWSIWSSVAFVIGFYVVVVAMTFALAALPLWIRQRIEARGVA